MYKASRVPILLMCSQHMQGLRTGTIFNVGFLHLCLRLQHSSLHWDLIPVANCSSSLEFYTFKHQSKWLSEYYVPSKLVEVCLYIYMYCSYSCMAILPFYFPHAMVWYENSVYSSWLEVYGSLEFFSPSGIYRCRQLINSVHH